MHQRCLVTGGTGFVGSHLVEGLLTAGRPVTCTVRSTSDPRWLKGTGAQLVPCDLRRVDEIKKALFNVDLVFHVAGAINASSREEFLQVNAGLTLNLLGACADQEIPPRFVYVSSQAAAGPSRGVVPRDEGMPPEPVSDYGRSKLAGEEGVRAYSGRLPWVIVRPPVVYGPRDRAMLTVFKLARSPIRPTPGSNRPLSLIYVEDLVEGMLKAGTSDAADGRVYFLAHPEPTTMGGLGDALARVMGKRGVTVPIPAPVIKGAALISETAMGLLGRTAALNRDKAREITQPGWVCSTEKAERDLGFTATTPHEEGLAATAAWYRAAGWL
ncbi:MAG: NAD-dependent epimerase/dehydratase family protein [Dehalococcoidia bacterium]